MRVNHLALLLTMVGILMLFSSSLNNQALAASGTGVGIREDGPALADLNDTIEYSITVYNLGDYWIRNTTVTDTLPNGTSLSWKVPDLAPVGQAGNSYNESGINYTIQIEDLISPPSSGNNSSSGLPFVINQAEVTGYADVQGLRLPVQAETNYPTSVIIPVVGGYAVNIGTTDPPMPNTAQVTLLASIAVIFSILAVSVQTTRLRNATLIKRIIQIRIIEYNS